MLSYKNGSWRMGQDVGAFAVPRLQWVGLRPSQVFKLPLPPDVMQRSVPSVQGLAHIRH